MQRAVITGATGSLGVSLIQELSKHSIEVLALCREDSQRNDNIPQHPLVTRRYCSLQQLASMENDTGKTYDVFYHFAWAGTTGQARDDMYLQTKNIRYALDAVKTAQRFGCHTFIGAGSQAEYGRTNEKMRPDTPVFPETGYGMAKLCAGQMTRELASHLGLKHIWVRIVSLYGANDGEHGLVMPTINKLLRGDPPQFTKGEQMWDYLYSEDAAEAFYLLGEKGIDGKTYVLGSGTARPLAEYIKEIRDAVSPGAAINMGAVAYHEKQIMYLCADNSELKKDTGWQPKVSFKEGILKEISRNIK